jgi:hypothetical protein
MNEAQRAYYETLKQFRKAPPPTEAPPARRRVGRGGHRWRCAKCGDACIGEPVRWDLGSNVKLCDTCA